MELVRDLRAAFVDEFGYCWFCGATYELCCHEIAKGADREAALPKRFCWAVACNACNEGPLNDYSVWPLVRQLAVKWREDWKWFYLVAFNLLRRRSSMAITFTEVVPHICRELDGNG
jgi:hypothetical protein